MRLLLGCLLLFIWDDVLFAQQQAPVLKIDSLPVNGVIQLTGWKYHEGDNPAYKDPFYDDNNWETGNYEKIEMPEFMAGHPRHLGWFRVKFTLPDSLKKHQLGIWIQCMGATETYLNGILVAKSGRIDPDPKKVRPENQTLDALPVTLSPDSIQVLAMRFAYQTKVPYFQTPYQLTAITVMFGRMESIVKNMHATLRPSYFLFFTFFAGLYFILFVLHACFYFFYRRGIQNFFYSLTNLSSTAAWALMPVMLYTEDTITRALWQVPFRLTYVLGGLFFVLTIYEMFGYRLRKILIGYFVFAASVFALSFFNKNFLSLLFLMPNIYYLEAIRVAWKRRKDHSTAAAVVITALLFNLVVSTLGVYFLSTGNYQLAMFFITCSGAIVSIAISVAIARQFADTNISLQQKLAEVEQLSAEKNKILTEQNVVLEESVKQRTAELNRSVQDLKATQSRLEVKNRELEAEKKRAEQALNELQSTQKQLVHAEKMASLGELTAGIAHEIQNPLNFVNNFSEVNKELIEEMNGQLALGNLQEAKQIGNDIKENEEKINHHGKRADAIVKNMLLHSSSGMGKKELTDINALADEYMRLAFHGQRARDNSFNAKLETELDPSLGKMEIIPQDLGRVLLNLLNNAFFAVDERRKSNKENYEPTVKLSSKKTGDGIKISVTDNGGGIPEKIRDKIFQPFFTTKATGQGTGLGLSLSYDIIKSQGGEILVSSKDGEGSEFSITLPFNKTNA